MTVGFSDQDAVLALGVVPVGIRDWYGDQPHATWPWASDELGDAEPAVLSSAELNLAQIAALEPDLIIGLYSGMTAPPQAARPARVRHAPRVRRPRRRPVLQLVQLRGDGSPRPRRAMWISGDPATNAKVGANPLRQQLHAVAEGREIFLGQIEAGAFSFSSPLSLPYLLDVLVPQLEAAVDGDPATAVPVVD